MNNNRRAFSLFEVILAIAILAITGGVIAQMLEVSRLASLRAARETEALLLAESILAELITQANIPAEVSNQPHSDSAEWFYSVTVEPLEFSTLYRIGVEVRHINPQDRQDATIELVRWLTIPDESEKS